MQAKTSECIAISIFSHHIDILAESFPFQSISSHVPFRKHCNQLYIVHKHPTDNKNEKYKKNIE